MKINLVVENIGGFEVKTTKKEGKLGGQIWMNNYASRIQPNQRKGTRWQERFWKLTLMLKMFMVLGVKTTKKQGKLGAKFAWKLMCPEWYQITENKYKATTEIMKINLVVENVVGFGLKTTNKQGKLGAKFAWKIICPEFNQIKGKVQGDMRDFGN